MLSPDRNLDRAPTDRGWGWRRMTRFYSKSFRAAHARGGCNSTRRGGGRVLPVAAQRARRFADMSPPAPPLAKPGKNDDRGWYGLKPECGARHEMPRVVGRAVSRQDTLSNSDIFSSLKEEYGSASPATKCSLSIKYRKLRSILLMSLPNEVHGSEVNPKSKLNVI